jgi:hypothetical protein
MHQRLLDDQNWVIHDRTDEHDEAEHRQHVQRLEDVHVEQP